MLPTFVDLPAFTRHESLSPKPTAATMMALLEIANEYLGAHQVGDDGMWLSADIDMDERMQGLNDNEVCGLILKELGQVDGVMEVHWRPCPSVVEWLSQLTFALTGCRQIDEPRLTRRYVRTDEYDGHGKAHGFINRRHNWIRLEVLHHISHPTPATKGSTSMITVTDEMKTFLRIAPISMAVGLYEQFVQVYGFVLNCGQVLGGLALKRCTEEVIFRCDQVEYVI